MAALNTISANSHGNVIQCCSDMFSLWLERQPEASWGQLINALIRINLGSLANEVEALLKPVSQVQQNPQKSMDPEGSNYYI